MELGKIVGVYNFVTFDGEAPAEEPTPTEEPEQVDIDVPVAEPVTV